MDPFQRKTLSSTVVHTQLSQRIILQTCPSVVQCFLRYVWRHDGASLLLREKINLAKPGLKWLCDFEDSMCIFSCLKFIALLTVLIANAFARKNRDVVSAFCSAKVSAQYRVYSYICHGRDSLVTFMTSSIYSSNLQCHAHILKKRDNCLLSAKLK